jgi:hypothetical protein
LFYERTDYLPHGITVAVGPTITHSTRWDRDDELLFPAYVKGTFSTRPRIGWNVGVSKYWMNKRLIFFNRIDLGLTYKRFNGSEKFNGVDMFGGDVFEKRIFHENRGGIFLSGSNIYGLSKSSWIQTKIGVGVDYAYKRSTEGEYYNLPRNYSELFRAQSYIGLGMGKKLSDGLFVLGEFEAPLFQLFPGIFVDQRMHYFHSHYYPIQFKVSLMWAKHKPVRSCDEIKKGPEDVSTDKPGRHDKSTLFGPDMKKSKKKKKRK